MARIPFSQRACRASAANPDLSGTRWFAILAAFVLAWIAFAPCVRASSAGVEKIIRGTVRDDQGAVPGAVVRIQATEYSTVTGREGEFELAVPASLRSPAKLTAWAKGYLIGGPVEASPGRKDITISLLQAYR